MASENLAVRVQVMKLGLDQVVLAFAIAWVAKKKFGVSVELQILPLKGGEHEGQGIYENVILDVGDAQFVGSSLHRELRLPEIAELLRGPLGDLCLGSRAVVRLELLEQYAQLQEQAMILLVQNKFELNDLDTSVFVDEAVEFHKRLMKLIDERLAPKLLAAA